MSIHNVNVEKYEISMFSDDPVHLLFSFGRMKMEIHCSAAFHN